MRDDGCGGGAEVVAEGVRYFDGCLCLLPPCDVFRFDKHGTQVLNLHSTLYLLIWLPDSGTKRRRQKRNDLNLASKSDESRVSFPFIVSKKSFFCNKKSAWVFIFVIFSLKRFGKPFVNKSRRHSFLKNY